jgi:hypothetical protein
MQRMANIPAASTKWKRVTRMGGPFAYVKMMGGIKNPA